MTGVELARRTLAERYPPGGWYRAAAVVLRQELEAELARLWDLVGLPATDDCPGKTQLVSLPFYLGDDRLAAKVRLAWNRLSRFCHAAAYGVPATADELHAWAEIVERLAGHLDLRGAR